MNYKLFIVVFCIFTYSLSAQKDIDSVGLIEDLKIFKNILQQGHPSLYEYISKDSLDYLFDNIEASSRDGLTDIELYKNMLKITDAIKDGHLLLFAPNTIKTDQYYFPLILKIINTEFYTDTDDFGIPIGSKINSINGERMPRVLEKLKKYSPTDGYNLTRKYRDIELKFGLFFAYEYGIVKQYTIEYIEPDGLEKTISLPAESFVKVKLRNTKRSSYFSKYHYQKNNPNFFDKYISNREPFVYYKEELNAAVLVINSFAGDIRIFKSNLTKIFKEINKKKIAHLIIDVRNNDGGFRSNAVNLYSFITKKAFKQTVNEFVISLSVLERKYKTQTFLSEKEFLKDKFKNHAVFDGWRLPFDDQEPLMVPDQNRYNGSVYILAGGTTFSAGATFVLNAKNDPDITIIGEDTGGGYYFHTGEFPVYYEFPNSKTQMVMSMVKVTHYVKEKSIPKGSGIPPDKHIVLSQKDLIEGKDPQLDYVLRLISRK